MKPETRAAKQWNPYDNAAWLVKTASCAGAKQYIERMGSDLTPQWREVAAIVNGLSCRQTRIAHVAYLNRQARLYRERLIAARRPSEETGE